jgi:putative GTP pyrophosphokinase
VTEEDKGFDFKQHAQAALGSYLERRNFFEELAVVVRRILEEALKRRGIKVHSVQARSKDPTEVARKAAMPSNEDPTRPKYSKPLDQITDLAAARIITYFPNTLVEIDDLLGEEFKIVEKSNKGADLIEEDRFGYQSIHYLVRLTPQRALLPEYEPYAEAITEIQVRTILQHAWAEIEHDIQYKSSSVIPAQIRRRFMALAGMFEIADREFQTIQNDDERLRTEARSNVKEGQLDNVEITPDALKAFLDQKLGPDGRIGDFSYDWTARMLRKLGFRTLKQVERCIRGYDDDMISRIASGTRQGQTTRFEYMVLAGMGENYLRRHNYAKYPWWSQANGNRLSTLRSTGIEIGDYDPMRDTGGEPSNEQLTSPTVSDETANGAAPQEN